MNKDDMDYEEECDDPDETDHDYGYDDEDYLIDGVGFADEGGESALRAETPNNPRNRPCPTCGRKNMLTPLDVRAGYQCDRCATACERGYDIEWVGDDDNEEEDG